MALTRTARRGARGNRWGLGLLGLLLAAAGAAGAAAGAGLLGPEAAGVRIGAAAAAAPPWAPYAAAAAAVLIALAALRWLLVQARPEAVRHVLLEPEEGRGRSEAAAGAVQGAVEEAVAGLPGVRRVRARLIDSARDPRLRLDLTLEEDADVVRVRSRIRDEALRDLRTALEADRVPAVVRMAMTPPRRDRRRVA
ncbi:alkaline shock response membrane anchor protein AmaP [Nocardiopsis sp. CNT-189]|uniref:alkaline shock response membrane anchor protein AmaP n=1 Tax=Nocardiopsis oceanisediminis TaxID=2816862 RepID=UPI003B2E880E